MDDMNVSRYYQYIEYGRTLGKTGDKAMAFYVFITTTDQRRIKVGHFTTREAAETAAAVIAQGDLSRIESIEISGDIMPNA
jgi:hypothetical protein